MHYFRYTPSNPETQKEESLALITPYEAQSDQAMAGLIAELMQYKKDRVSNLSAVYETLEELTTIASSRPASLPVKALAKHLREYDHLVIDGSTNLALSEDRTGPNTFVVSSYEINPAIAPSVTDDISFIDAVRKNNFTRYAYIADPNNWAKPESSEPLQVDYSLGHLTEGGEYEHVMTIPVPDTLVL